jgi:DNA repair protein RadA/Sms
MVKSQTSFVCQQCGYISATLLGKCPNCDLWNTLVETFTSNKPSTGSTKRSAHLARVLKLSEIKDITTSRIPTGFSELDRVLGGGIVLGAVTLVAGNPGIGKSTLLLELAGNLGGLYVSGEESPSQVKLRANRLQVKTGTLRIYNEIDVDTICTQIQELKPQIVIIDSIQTMSLSEMTGTAGSVGQVRESTNRLINTVKPLGIPLFLVGHVTKEGAIAGPKVLEHLVDTVLYLEGEQFHSFRILRSTKNRFGPTDEVGVFQMNDKGISEVSNPSDIFLGERVKNVPGSVVVATKEGNRVILVEIQALVVPTTLAMPRRVGIGVDYNRLQLLTAILTKRLGLQLSASDIFVNVAGGLTLSEPAADLGIALAIISSCKNKPLDGKTVAVGELGLLGEIRMVSDIEKRTKEAKKLGFSSVVSPKDFKNLVEVVRKVFV